MSLIGGGRLPMPGEHIPSTQGLPKAFLHSLRTLFEILDDRRRGSVHIQEIETRWQGADTLELPPGVLQCLRKVAPSDGYLTFERFVLGLRISLLNSQNRDPGGVYNEIFQAGVHLAQGKAPGKVYVSKPVPLGVRYMNGGRDNAGRCLEKVHVGNECPSAAYRGEQNRNGSQRAPGGVERQKNGGEAQPNCRSQSENMNEVMTDQVRHRCIRGPHRRHTITNGVDYSVLKRMKELEQDKDFLIQGLEMVERARDWYHQQIQAVQEQQRNLGKTQNEFFSEGRYSPLGHVLPKLQEVNRCLGELVCPGKAGAPSPAVPAGNTPPVVAGGQHRPVNMLKEQNRLLTKEVSDKSDRITQLEQEKSALIKQLFEARARGNPEASQLDSTFI
ncbi:suppressor APC domain-containing protein 2 isoform X1 [Ascaphus truei]|uniref:suppressor APC domain-containing protein 2 isoform X1 n=1 Tax=Ascaphus truei TaxID=8439 RepID=UPI003F5A8169